jgi:lipoate-protein ligase A
VLGSTQRHEVVDARRAERAGVTVSRRRSGGGAVLVTPDDPVWVDFWVPRGDPLWRDDVARAFDWVGDAWVTALAGLGMEGLGAHRGGYASCTRWSGLIWFGGVGTGEVVTADGRKVVGLSQRRSREGAWFHGACYLHWDPSGLLDVLDLPDHERTAARVALGEAAVGAADLVPGQAVDAQELVSSLLASLP